MKNLTLRILCLLTLSFPAILKAQPANNWWNNSTFYEIFVRSFYDSNADGIGDFNGLTSKLDYLNDGKSETTSDLGINGIWLMPMNASPSYHGYDVINYKDVNSQYGTKADFKNLVAEAHKRGIKVIIDFVINHTSSQHPWFVKALANDPKYRDFYRWSSSLPTYKGPWGQTVWHTKNSNNYYGIFWSEMPDLNYNHQPVKDSIYSAAEYWIKDMDVDGFRLDAAMYLYEKNPSAGSDDLKNQPETFQFWADLNTYCKGLKPSFVCVGEVWDASSVNIQKYNNKMDYCFEFNVASAVLNSVNSGNTSSLVTAVNYAYNNLQNNQFGTFLTNHDQDRVSNYLGGNLPKMKAAASIYLTLPGNPYLYYGEEVGMSGSGADENKRLPMQWTSGTNAGFTTNTNPWNITGTFNFPMNTNFTTYNVETMTSDANSIYNHYKKLLQIRNNNEGIKNGTYQNIPTSDPSVYAFLRRSGAQQFIVLVNTANKTVNNLSMTVWATDNTDKTFSASDVLNNDAIEEISVANSLATGVSLNAYETKILSVTEPIITSISEGINNQISLNIYPNPGKDLLNIQVQTQNGDKESIVGIYNSLGELNATYTLVGNQTNVISIASLPMGIYYIKAANGKAVKFLKQ